MLHSVAVYNQNILEYIMENARFETAQLLMAEVKDCIYLDDAEYNTFSDACNNLLMLPMPAAVAAANAIFTTMYPDLEERKAAKKALKVTELECLIKVKMEEIAEMRKEIAVLTSKKKVKETNFLDITPGAVYRHVFPDGSSAWVILNNNKFKWSCTATDDVAREGEANSLTGVCKAIQSVRGKGGNMNASRWFASFKTEEEEVANLDGEL